MNSVKQQAEVAALVAELRHLNEHQGASSATGKSLWDQCPCLPQGGEGAFTTWKEKKPLYLKKKYSKSNSANLNTRSGSDDLVGSLKMFDNQSVEKLKV